ncbi:MAG TPA: hypothetical protein GXX36_11645 [Clostridiaceae bacterium]|nr:hypothetical protein [Clostridiaceae bacterium]
MNNDSISMSMSDILGCTKKQIASYYGMPVIEYPSLAVFKSNGGYIAISFVFGKSTAYALYNNFGEIQIASVNVLNLPFAELQKWENRSYSEFVHEYGQPHFEVGSGMTVLGYFGINGSIYTIQTIKNTISHIAEIKISNK